MLNIFNVSYFDKTDNTFRYTRIWEDDITNLRKLLNKEKYQLLEVTSTKKTLDKAEEALTLKAYARNQ